MIPLTVKERESYFKQEICHMSKKNITDINNRSEFMFIKYCRVRDHCHYTEKYRGAAHDVKHQNKFL